MGVARSPSETDERRRYPRINIPFPATVQGLDNGGHNFSVETVLDNLSSKGLFLRMMPCVEPGAKLCIEIQMRTGRQLEHEGARLSVDGVVLRADKLAGGASGVAVSFAKVRFP